MTDEFDLHGALPAAETVAPAAADAAASLQLAEEASGPDQFACGTAAVTRHPATKLFDRIVLGVLPSVQAFAALKNVPIEEDEVMRVAHHAVRKLSRLTMQAITRLDADALVCVRDSLSDSLDTLCLAKFIFEAFVASGRGADMESAFTLATRILAKDHANDRASPVERWPDMKDMVAHFLRLGTAMDDQVQTLTLPEDVIRQVMVRLPVNIQFSTGGSS